MKLKFIVAGLLAAASFGASAATIYAPSPITTTSFVDAVIGTITVGGMSNISGNVFAADSISFGPVSLSLDHVTFTGGGVTSLTDLDPSAAGFNFHNVAAGTYTVVASGMLTPDGEVHKLALLGANYNVTAVPEPETYGMLLGGLAVLGAVARRKAKNAA